MNEIIIDNDNLRQTQEYFNKIIKTMNCEIERILSHKKSNCKDLIKKLYIDTTKVQIPYPYFLPDISKVNNYFNFELNKILYYFLCIYVVVIYLFVCLGKYRHSQTNYCITK